MLAAKKALNILKWRAKPQISQCIQSGQSLQCLCSSMGRYFLLKTIYFVGNHCNCLTEAIPSHINTITYVFVEIKATLSTRY